MPFDINEYVRPANVPWIHGIVPPDDDVAEMFNSCVMVNFPFNSLFFC